MVERYGILKILLMRKTDQKPAFVEVVVGFFGPGFGKSSFIDNRLWRAAKAILFCKIKYGASVYSFLTLRRCDASLGKGTLSSSFAFTSRSVASDVLEKLANRTARTTQPNNPTVHRYAVSTYRQL